MKEQYVISLEISKQLKEAGWKKETEFEWCNVGSKDADTWILYHHTEMHKYYPKGELFAPLATEILEELPREIILQEQGKIFELVITHTLSGYYVYYFCFRYLDDEKTMRDEGLCPIVPQDTLPNALAKMWLYLKKEGRL
jgi:hypothetical protein